MISFPTSSIALLTSIQNEIEPLAFRLTNSQFIKAVLPNKQLIDESLSQKSEDTYTFFFNKTQLATWLQSQKTSKPDAAFVNAEVARYEMEPTAPCNSIPPLIITANWKFEQNSTNIRVDYHLNPQSPITGPILNVNFNTNVTGSVTSCRCDPEAKWSPENSTLSWGLFEISRNGEAYGSLKAIMTMNSTNVSC